MRTTAAGSHRLGVNGSNWPHVSGLGWPHFVDNTTIVPARGGPGFRPQPAQPWGSVGAACCCGMVMRENAAHDDLKSTGRAAALGQGRVLGHGQGR